MSDSSLDENIIKSKANTKNIIETFDKTFRKRFIRDKGEISRKHAIKAVAERESREIKSKKENRRDKNVVLYRRYRSGDFPDFLINSLAILMPLQALARKDQHIAKTVFISVFEALIINFKESGAAEELKYYSLINSAISTILMVVYFVPMITS